MHRVALGLLALAVVLALAAQLLLTGVLEGRVADRLESGGGEADVSLGAFPALRLLAKDGDSFRVEATGVRLDIEERARGLDELDGFDEVGIRLRRSAAGPLDIASFELARPEDEDEYDLAMDATTSPRELARFLGSRAGGALGGLLGDLAAGSLPGGGTTPVPFELEAAMRSQDGRIDVGRAEVSVAGIPAGPLAALIVASVVESL